MNKVELFTTRIARFLAPKFIEELENRAKARDEEVNQRVASIVTNLDPFEPYMRRFKGVFSEEFDFPESKLNEQGKIGMMMWGYQQDTDMHFKFLLDYIINTQANATMKRKAIDKDEMLYARAKIVTAIQIKDEVRRLANHYRDYLQKVHEDEEPEIGMTVDD